jgi:hypothetical protein
MDKELIWKVLAEEQGCKLSGEDCNGKSCLRYYTCKGITSAILKLFKERMLELIGKNKKMPKETDECKYAEQTANELRAELRKKVGER